MHTASQQTLGWFIFTFFSHNFQNLSQVHHSEQIHVFYGHIIITQLRSLHVIKTYLKKATRKTNLLTDTRPTELRNELFFCRTTGQPVTRTPHAREFGQSRHPIMSKYRIANIRTSRLVEIPLCHFEARNKINQ